MKHIYDNTIISISSCVLILQIFATFKGAWPNSMRKVLVKQNYFHSNTVTWEIGNVRL